MSIIKQNSVLITMEIAMNLTAIEKYKELWKEKGKSLDQELLASMRNSGTFESIGSSNRIEGNTLSNEEVEKLLSGLKTKSFKSRDEEEVMGYADLLSAIYENYKGIPITESYIKQLHQMLLRYSSKDERHRGECKKLGNAVAAFDGEGKEIGIVFKTATPFDTPIQMRDLVSEINDILLNPAFSPIIAIGLFIVHFLAIHPFQDGNGRLSRLLTTLLLLRSEYSYVQYYSLEKIIEESKNLYYSALRKTQITFGSDHIDYTPWLQYFTSALKSQTIRLEEKIKAYSESKETPSIKGSDMAVLTVIKNLKGAGLSEIRKELPDMTDNEVKTALRHLLALGVIEKQGKNKGTWYKEINH